MSSSPRLMCVLLALASAAVFAQPGPPAPGAPGPPPPVVVEQPVAPAVDVPPELAATRQFLEEAGMPRDKATMLSLLVNTVGDDISTILPMLMMMGDGHGGGDMGGFMLMMMLSKASSGSKAAPFGFWHDDIAQVAYIIEDGWLYKVSFATMQVLEKVPYRPAKTGGGGLAALQAIMPALAGARERAVCISCQSNLKQLALGALMYAQDHDEILPHANWMAEIMPYVKNEAIFACPGRQGTGLAGYAMNKQLIQADLKALPDPAGTILFFEVGVDLKDQVGGADDVPPGGVHDGQINAAFADGHVKLISPDAAKQMLGQ